MSVKPQIGVDRKLSRAGKPITTVTTAIVRQLAGFVWSNCARGWRLRSQSRIRQILNDPAVAEMLCPSYPIGARRLIQAGGYCGAFNRDNVSLVDISEDGLAGC
jgi:cation diffusion facilitator CzcD-associated flavoprotein CzcO